MCTVPPPATPSPLLIPAPPPQNGGICEDAESSTYVCRCPHGFTGSNCEYSQALHCHPGGCPPRGDVTRCPPWLDAGPPPGAHRPSLSPPRAEACGPDATCVNRPDGQGYSCRCHLGKSGERCTEGEHGWGRGHGAGSPPGTGARGWGQPQGRGHGVGTTLGTHAWGWDDSGDVGMGTWASGWGLPWGHKYGDGGHPGDMGAGLGTTMGRWAQGDTGRVGTGD